MPSTTKLKFIAVADIQLKKGEEISVELPPLMKPTEIHKDLVLTVIEHRHP
jgi:hypothetical protein